MQKFISCDWGTSALRLRIIDADKMSLLAETANEQGILSVFNLWKESSKSACERPAFYQSVLLTAIREIEEKVDFSLEEMPLIVSGMASSSIGMMELPYIEIPFSTDAHDLYTETIQATSDFRHRMLIVSGVRTSNDVMRGEETQLIGCLDDNSDDQLFIFPVTHSKHISVKKEEVVDFTTFMTGEFFELLSKKSILSNTVEEGENISEGNNLESFEKGVADASHMNLLHSSFLVRTNTLLNKLSKQENYFYLSGVVIGTELKYLPAIKTTLTVVSDPLLAKLYNIALQKLGVHKVRYCDAGKALIAGHCKIYETRNN
jgi:2-dehydro-3-deoxygalactonokinase